MNKYRRNRHQAIRNIQRTSWLGTMTYREAHRKYKAGYRAVPGRFLINFGSDKLTLAQVRKLGEEYAHISEHAESVQRKATMTYDTDMRCFKFRYSSYVNVWQFAISFEEATLLIDCGRLAECVTRSAETDIPNLKRHDFVKISETSITAYSNEGITGNDVRKLERIRDRIQNCRLAGMQISPDVW